MVLSKSDCQGRQRWPGERTHHKIKSSPGLITGPACGEAVTVPVTQRGLISVLSSHSILAAGLLSEEKVDVCESKGHTALTVLGPGGLATSSLRDSE